MRTAMLLGLRTAAAAAAGVTQARDVIVVH